ncbi:LOW QUALITY PROTEIN: DDB1- and CUL4-associated factor 16 [Rhynchocyon petersi]
MGPRNLSPDPLSDSENEDEEDSNYLNESSDKEWDFSEEDDFMVSTLMPLESRWQVKFLLIYSTTWKPFHPSSWSYDDKLLDPSTPVHVLETGLRLCHCSHCVHKLEPIPEFWPLVEGILSFQTPLISPSCLTRDATLNGALQFDQLSQTLNSTDPIPEYLKQIPSSCVSGCCCGQLTKAGKGTTYTEAINTTYSSTDFQKAVNTLLTASL